MQKFGRCPWIFDHRFFLYTIFCAFFAPTFSFFLNIFFVAFYIGLYIFLLRFFIFFLYIFLLRLCIFFIASADFPPGIPCPASPIPALGPVEELVQREAALLGEAGPPPPEAVSAADGAAAATCVPWGPRN